MAFKSKSQLRKFEELVNLGKMNNTTFEEWKSKTSNIEKLPERSSIKISKVKRVKVK